MNRARRRTACGIQVGHEKGVPGQEAKAATIVESVGAPASPGPAPAAPSTTSNFEGLTFTGSIPADCTMAVGPSHVMVAVNSVFGLFGKNGGAALWTFTLEEWFDTSITARSLDPGPVLPARRRWVFLAWPGPGTTQSYFLLSSGHRP